MSLDDKHGKGGMDVVPNDFKSETGLKQLILIKNAPIWAFRNQIVVLEPDTWTLKDFS